MSQQLTISALFMIMEHPEMIDYIEYPSGSFDMFHYSISLQQYDDNRVSPQSQSQTKFLILRFTPLDRLRSSHQGGFDYEVSRWGYEWNLFSGRYE